MVVVLSKMDEEPELKEAWTAFCQSSASDFELKGQLLEKFLVLLLTKASDRPVVDRLNFSKHQLISSYIGSRLLLELTHLIEEPHNGEDYGNYKYEPASMSKPHQPQSNLHECRKVSSTSLPNLINLKNRTLKKSKSDSSLEVTNSSIHSKFDSRNLEKRSKDNEYIIQNQEFTNAMEQRLGNSSQSCSQSDLNWRNEQINKILDANLFTDAPRGCQLGKDKVNEEVLDGLLKFLTVGRGSKMLMGLDQIGVVGSSILFEVIKYLGRIFMYSLNKNSNIEDIVDLNENCRTDRNFLISRITLEDIFSSVINSHNSYFLNPNSRANELFGWKNTETLNLQINRKMSRTSHKRTRSRRNSYMISENVESDCEENITGFIKSISEMAPNACGCFHMNDLKCSHCNDLGSSSLALNIFELQDIILSIMVQFALYTPAPNDEDNCNTEFSSYIICFAFDMLKILLNDHKLRSSHFLFNSLLRSSAKLLLAGCEKYARNPVAFNNILRINVPQEIIYILKLLHNPANDVIDGLINTKYCTSGDDDGDMNEWIFSTSADMIKVAFKIIVAISCQRESDSFSMDGILEIKKFISIENVNILKDAFLLILKFDVNVLLLLAEELSRIVAYLKVWSCDYLHKESCKKSSHKLCDYSFGSHHHFFGFGTAANFLPANAKLETECLISRIVELNLWIFQICSASDLCSNIISNLSKSGLCCCMNLINILQYLFYDIEKKTKQCQQFIFNFIENNVLSELNAHKSIIGNSECDVCIFLDNTLNLPEETVSDSSIDDRDISTYPIFSGTFSAYFHHMQSSMSLLITNHVIRMLENSKYLVIASIFSDFVIKIFENLELKETTNCQSIDIDSSAPVIRNMIKCVRLCFEWIRDANMLKFLNNHGLKIIKTYKGDEIIRKEIFYFLCKLVEHEQRCYKWNLNLLIYSNCYIEEMKNIHELCKLYYEKRSHILKFKEINATSSLNVITKTNNDLLLECPFDETERTGQDDDINEITDFHDVFSTAEDLYFFTSKMVIESAEFRSYISNSLIPEYASSLLIDLAQDYVRFSSGLFDKVSPECKSVDVSLNLWKSLLLTLLGSNSLEEKSHVLEDFRCHLLQIKFSECSFFRSFISMLLGSSIFSQDVLEHKEQYFYCSPFSMNYNVSGSHSSVSNIESDGYDADIEVTFKQKPAAKSNSIYSSSLTNFEDCNTLQCPQLVIYAVELIINHQQYFETSDIEVSDNFCSHDGLSNTKRSNNAFNDELDYSCVDKEKKFLKTEEEVEKSIYNKQFSYSLNLSMTNDEICHVTVPKNLNQRSNNDDLDLEGKEVVIDHHSDQRIFDIKKSSDMLHHEENEILNYDGSEPFEINIKSQTSHTKAGQEDISNISGKSCSPLNENHLKCTSECLYDILMLCRQSKSINLQLQEINFLQYLIKGFSKIIKENDPLKYDFIGVILELWYEVAQHHIGSLDLNLYFDLFKASKPPLQLLLHVFCRLFEQTNHCPHIYVKFTSSFDVENFHDESCDETFLTSFMTSISSLTSFVEIQRPLSPVVESVMTLKKNHLKLGLSSCFSVGGVACPIPRSLDWSMYSEGVSVAGWISLQHFNEVHLITPNTGRTVESGITEKAEIDFSKGKVNSIHLFSIGTKHLMFSLWLNVELDKIIITASIETDQKSITVAEAELPGVNWRVSKWHHLALIVPKIKISNGDVVKVVVIMDGIDFYEAKLTIPPVSSVRKSTHSLFILGQSNNKFESEYGNNSRCSYKTKSKQILYVAIGIFFVFREPILCQQTCLGLMSLGMNSTSLLAVGPQPHKTIFASLVTRKLLASQIDCSFLFKGLRLLMEPLQESLFLQYSPHSSEEFVYYKKFLSTAEYGSGYPLCVSEKVILMNPCEKIEAKSPVSALLKLGGATVMIFLFARVAELGCSDRTLAEVLSLIFKISRSEPSFGLHFASFGGINLIFRLLKSPKVHCGTLVLKALLEACIEPSVLQFDACLNAFIVASHIRAYLVDRNLFEAILINWNCFYKDRNSNTKYHEEEFLCVDPSGRVLNGIEIIMSVIKVLLTRNFCYRKFNFIQLKDIKTMTLITNMFEELKAESILLKDVCSADLIISVLSSLLEGDSSGQSSSSSCIRFNVGKPTGRHSSLGEPKQFQLLDSGDLNEIPELFIRGLVFPDLKAETLKELGQFLLLIHADELTFVTTQKKNAYYMTNVSDQSRTPNELSLEYSFFGEGGSKVLNSKFTRFSLQQEALKYGDYHILDSLFSSSLVEEAEDALSVKVDSDIPSPVGSGNFSDFSPQDFGKAETGIYFSDTTVSSFIDFIRFRRRSYKYSTSEYADIPEKDRDLFSKSDFEVYVVERRRSKTNNMKRKTKSLDIPFLWPSSITNVDSEHKVSQRGRSRHSSENSKLKKTKSPSEDNRTALVKCKSIEHENFLLPVTSADILSERNNIFTSSATTVDSNPIIKDLKDIDIRKRNLSLPLVGNFNNFFPLESPSNEIEFTLNSTTSTEAAMNFNRPENNSDSQFSPLRPKESNCEKCPEISTSQKTSNDNLNFGNASQNLNEEAVKEQMEKNMDYECTQNLTMISHVIAGVLRSIDASLNQLSETQSSIVISEMFGIELIVILANNPSTDVRASALKLIRTMLHRGPREFSSYYLKGNLTHLLSQQISKHPATSEDLINEAICFALKVQPQKRVDERDFGPLRSNHKVSLFMPLFGLLPNLVGDITLCHSSLNILLQIFNKNKDFLIKLYGKTYFVSSLLLTLRNIYHYHVPGLNISLEAISDVLVDDIKEILCYFVNHVFSLCNSTSILIFREVLCLVNQFYKKEILNCGRDVLSGLVFFDLHSSLLRMALESLQDASKDLGFHSLSPDGSSSAGFPTTINSDAEERKNLHGLRKLTSLFTRPSKKKNSETGLGQIGYDHRSSAVVENIDTVFQLSVQHVFIAGQSQRLNRECQRDFSLFLLRLLASSLACIAQSERVGSIEGPPHGWNYSVTMISSSVLRHFCRLLNFLVSSEIGLDIRIATVLAITQESNIEQIFRYISFLDMSVLHRLAIFLHDLQTQIENKRQSNLKSPSDGQSNEEVNSDRIEEALDSLLSFLSDCGVAVLPPIEEGVREWSIVKEEKRRVKDETEKLVKTILKVKYVEEKRFLLRGKFNVNYELVVTEGNRITWELQETKNARLKESLKRVKDAQRRWIKFSYSWKDLVEIVTQEKAPWHFPTSYPSGWRLDYTETRMRIRKRMMRSHLNIDPKFFHPHYSDRHIKDAPPLQSILMENGTESALNHIVESINEDENMLHTCHAAFVAPTLEQEGEFLISHKHIYFIGEEPSMKNNPGTPNVVSKVWSVDAVREIHPRRYRLNDCALELFSANGRSALFAFNDEKERDEVLTVFSKIHFPNMITKVTLSDYTYLWREGVITNFEYLTQLNKFGGRSFNDLMQYPVFPFILSDYSSNAISVQDPSIYRNLKKPIPIQNEEREEHFKTYYENTKQMGTDGPHHYGSHYSNSGIVLYYLIRLPPYTQLFLDFQDGNFDVPDRSFHSIETTWRLASSESTTAIRELIPEFFFLPEIFINTQGFKFGHRQNNTMVNHVQLPPWCREDPRKFVLVHRVLLESAHVTRHLQYWIDLVFGFKQTGKSAVEAINVFHPATYFGFDVGDDSDELAVEARKTMIRTYGQTPRQIFSAPHSTPLPGAFQLHKSGLNTSSSDAPQVLKEVSHIPWGVYAGSPADPKVKIQLVQPLKFDTRAMLSVNQSEVLFLSPKTVVHTVKTRKGDLPVLVHFVISWHHGDGIIRTRQLRGNRIQPLVALPTYNEVTSCVVSQKQLWLGTKCGQILVYLLNPQLGKGELGANSPNHPLIGHNEEVSCLIISQEFKVCFSGGADGVVCLWDVNRMNYIRSVSVPNTEISMLGVSETLGDWVSVTHSKVNQGPSSDVAEESSVLRYYTINGEFIESASVPSRVTCLVFSSAKEGRSVNVIAVGAQDRNIRLYSTWDLSLVRTLRCDRIKEPPVLLFYTENNQQLCMTTASLFLVVWETSQVKCKMPKFIPVCPNA